MKVLFVAEKSGPARVRRDGVLAVDRRRVRMLPAVSTLLFVKLMKGEVLVLRPWVPSKRPRKEKVFFVGSPERKSVSVAESHGPESVIAGDELVVLKERLKKFRAAVTELLPLAVPTNWSSGSLVPAVVMVAPSLTVMNERLTLPAIACTRSEERRVGKECRL